MNYGRLIPNISRMVYTNEGPNRVVISNITRVLYFFLIGNTAILTNGFTKKTQKTPVREIELAKKYREDYMRRSLGGE